MARFTGAYSSFVRRLGEVDCLSRLALRRERRDPLGSADEINALCRGAIVLLSSHLEAYVRELGETALENLWARQVPRTNLPETVFYHISKDVIEEIKDTADHAAISRKVFDFIANDIAYWSKNGPFPVQLPSEKFTAGFSNPGFKKISAYLRRFGYITYSNDLARRLTVSYKSTINMVDHLVDTRNKIAHGDTATTKTPSEVGDMVGIIKGFCTNTDIVFSDWFKANFCTIR